MEKEAMGIRKTARQAQAWVLGWRFQGGRNILVVKDGPPRDSSVLLLSLFLFTLQALSPTTSVVCQVSALDG